MLQRKEVMPVLNKSVVLLDIESLIFKARESLPATVDNVAIARIIGRHLLEIAERRGELVGAYMATAIARARDPIGLQRRYETWAIADALNGIGYSTLLVPIGPN
ncbi:MAG: hypothetical protein HY470_00215, partial [Candidatus Ryanbacteria bacterium]|nr:hypothetical protein [Candidatus Ryanbacteria bacterium]